MEKWVAKSDKREREEHKNIIGRPNKFRVWDKKYNRYFKPIYKANEGELEYLVLNLNGSLSLVNLDGIHHESVLKNRFEEVEFSIGDKDKYGKDIFVGDIVICDSESGLLKAEIKKIVNEHTFGSYVAEFIEEIEYDENYETGIEIISNVKEEKYCGLKADLIIIDGLKSDK